MSQISNFNSGVDFGILYENDQLLRSCVLMALKGAVGHSQRMSRGSLIAAVREAYRSHYAGDKLPGDRRIRNTIRDLRRDGALILSTGGRKGGYWKAESLNEVREFCSKELEARAKDLFWTASQMESAAMAEFGEQMVLIDLQAGESTVYNEKEGIK